MKGERLFRVFRDEADFQAQVTKAARQLGWARVYHTYDSRRSEEGFPDLVLVSRRQRRVIFAELKNDTEQETPEQKLWMDDLGVCSGVEVYLWRFMDWNEILTLLAGPSRLERERAR